MEKPAVIQVSLKSAQKTYPILIDPNLFQEAHICASYIRHRQVALLTNPVVAQFCLPLFKKNLEAFNWKLISIPEGEQHKSLATVEQIFKQLVQHGFDKSVTLIALGGGVVGDMAGFVASCYLRGVSYLQVPTTLLAQVDAALGGKTGVNYLGKNLIGTFYHPEAVLIDPSFLQTLPERQYLSGLAEVVKYALLDGDVLFFEWLEDNAQPLLTRQKGILTKMIEHCCRTKIHVVQQDEKDHSMRRILNLGHTFGHALESALSYETWLHGEAVSIGIIIAALISNSLGTLTTNELLRIKRLLEHFGLPTMLPNSLDKAIFLDFLARDKKIYNGQPHFVLLKGIGHAVITENISFHNIEEALTQV